MTRHKPWVTARFFCIASSIQALRSNTNRPFRIVLLAIFVVIKWWLRHTNYTRFAREWEMWRCHAGTRSACVNNQRRPVRIYFSGRLRFFFSFFFSLCFFISVCPALHNQYACAFTFWLCPFTLTVIFAHFTFSIAFCMFFPNSLSSLLNPFQSLFLVGHWPFPIHFTV